MTIIIIEGCDLSGKTYAIERIAKRLNSGFILKNTFKPKFKDDSEKLYKHYWEIIDLIDHHSGTNPDEIIILDRFFPSQAVYSYLRGEDEFDSDKINQLDIHAFRHSYLFIYVETDIEILRLRYLERGDEHIDITDLAQIKERYDNFFAKTKMTKIAINTQKDDWLENILRWIKIEY